jgi:hypothetical protein
MLSLGTFGLVFVPFFFLRVIPHSSSYSALPTHEPTRSNSNQLQRTKSAESHRHRRMSEPGRQSDSKDPDAVEEPFSPKLSGVGTAVAPEVPSGDTDETASLLSKSSSSGPGDISFQENTMKSDDRHDSQHLDIRGWALLPIKEFWLQFLMMGLLTGIGLMTIKYVQIPHLYQYIRPLTLDQQHWQ